MWLVKGRESRGLILYAAIYVAVTASALIAVNMFSSRTGGFLESLGGIYRGPHGSALSMMSDRNVQPPKILALIYLLMVGGAENAFSS